MGTNDGEGKPSENLTHCPSPKPPLWNLGDALLLNNLAPLTYKHFNEKMLEKCLVKLRERKISFHYFFIRKHGFWKFFIMTIAQNLVRWISQRKDLPIRASQGSAAPQSLSVIWLMCTGVSPTIPDYPWASSGSQHHFFAHYICLSLDDVPMKDVFFSAFPDDLIQHLLFARQSSRQWDYTTLKKKKKKKAKSLPSWRLFSWEETENKQINK